MFPSTKVQTFQGSSGKKDGARRRSSLLPEEIRDSETRLVASMELYRSLNLNFVNMV